MYVTRLGHTNYCAVPSKKDQHDEWMLWMRTALDMALGTDGVGPPPAAGGVAISREALQRGVLEPPKPAESEVGAVGVFVSAGCLEFLGSWFEGGAVSARAFVFRVRPTACWTCD